MTLKLTCDKEVDAAYIYLEYPITKGKLLDVEALNARKMLNKKTLLEARQVQSASDAP